MIKNPNRCCVTVYEGLWPKQCSKPVKARIGDKCYCTIHNPDRVPTDKEQAIIDARNAKAEAVAARERLNAAAPELLMRLADLCEGLEDMQLPGSLPARLRKAQAAIAKATGGAA